MRVSIAASAVAEPETPPIMVLITTETCARPPYIRRVSMEAKSRIRLADAGFIHQVARKNEKRNSQKRVRSRALCHNALHGD